MTVNYNFDDTIEFMLSNSEWNGDHENGRPYETTWKSYMQYRRRSAVIYHPNGFLPADKTKHQSEELVFSDEEFLDQLIESMSGKLSTLLHLFTKKTCLFIGLSLDDGTLKHLLRQAANICPGNYHYYIRYTKSNSTLSVEERKAIFNSYFHVYNLVTLFMCDEEIAALADLIIKEKNGFRNLAEEAGAVIKYIFYLTGTTCAGKSTVLSHFGNLQTTEEWMDKRPSELSRDYSTLSDKERQTVDLFVQEQFAKKNLFLLNQTEGVFLVDRSPLDPLAYAKGYVCERGSEIFKAICPGRATARFIVPGHCIILRSEERDFRIRLLNRQKEEWDITKIIDLQDNIMQIYTPPDSSIVDNSGTETIEAVVKAIAEIIFCKDYMPFDLQNRLLEFTKNNIF